MASLPALWHLGQQWLANGHLALALSIIWSLYLVLVGAWILLQRRAPVATIGWLLSMAVLPVVGLLVYFVFLVFQLDVLISQLLLSFDC